MTIQRIAYLCCAATLPGLAEPRLHAFEHDLSVKLLREAAAAVGAGVDEVRWDDPEADFGTYDAALIGTTWDYWDRHAEFLARLDQIASQTRLENPPPLVRWNSDKRYLAELARAGVPSIPTQWVDDATAAAVTAAFDALDTDRLVAKRQVGAGALGQHVLRRGEPVPAMPHPMLIQPFIEAITSEGEFSFLFIAGQLSHALVKRPRADDYRVQGRYGGKETAIDPTPADLAAATHALAAIGKSPLYARVDMVRGPAGNLLLMEIELIEPYFYPVQGPGVFAHLVRALGTGG